MNEVIMNLKKTIVLILISAFVAIGACFFAGCADDSGGITPDGGEVAVESVTLDPTQKTLFAGDTFSINVTVSPSDATNKNVTWSSSDEEIVTVKGGVVTAVGIGSATITATAGDKHGTCAIKVNGETELTLEVGENFGDKTVNGMPIVYPNLKGISTHGEDITDKIVMTSDKKGTFDKETETYTPKIEAMCWMQGENDSFSNKRYFALENEFVNSLRKKYAEYSDENGFAFVNGGITTYWPNYYQVNAAKQKNCELLADAEYIDAVGMELDYRNEPTGNPDYAHLDAQSMIKLGRAFGTAALKYFD